MTPAFFVVRLRQPRSALRVVLAYPGTLAGLAIVFGLFWITGFLYILFPNQMRPETTAAIAVGGTLAVTWGALALCRRWNGEPGWIDRAGRLLGLTAIGKGLIGLVLFRIRGR
jgi:hypothetical protein